MLLLIYQLYFKTKQHREKISILVITCCIRQNTLFAIKKAVAQSTALPIGPQIIFLLL